MTTKPSSERDLTRTSLSLAAVLAITASVVAQKEVSGEGTTPVKVAFHNTLDKTVQAIWIDFEGNEKDYGEIEAGATVAMETYSTHLWLFKSNGKTVAKYRAGSDANQNFDVKVAAAPNPAAAPMPVVKRDPKPAVGGNGSALTAKEAENLVAYHNKVRKDVGVSPVKWSNTIAKFSQEWADQLAATGKFEHRPRTGQWTQKYGENIAVGFGDSYGVAKGAADWYGEIKLYQQGTPIPADFSNFQAGHYTQMVWAKTTEIGAGKAVMQQGQMKGWTVIVCNYNPPGNFIGEKPY